jgi:hypothetical protein
MLRPMAVATNLALTEFYLSRDLAWYLVATGAAAVAGWWWCVSTLGFLSDHVALPALPWLPLLGGSVDPWGNDTGKNAPIFSLSLSARFHSSLFEFQPPSLSLRATFAKPLFYSPLY